MFESYEHNHPHEDFSKFNQSKVVLNACEGKEKCLKFPYQNSKSYEK